MVASFRYDKLRDSKAALRRFEARNGKVGSVARITGRSAKSVERIVSAKPDLVPMQSRRSKRMTDGAYLVTGNRRGRPGALGHVRFQNRSRRPVVIMQESQDAQGRSQGIQFVVLHPGDVFESMHNAPHVVVVLIVIGVVVIVVVVLVVIGESITDLLGFAARCKLITHTFSRDHCLGSCPANPATGFAQTCTTTGTRPYFFGGTQATACACV